MSLLSTEALRLLAERRAGWHVSLFLPMHRAGVDTLQNPVRCKNLLRQAEAHLLAGGLRASEVQTLLAPVSKLLEDYTFWQHQSESHLVEYFRQVDRGLAEVVPHTHVPVVLAGVEYLLPLYKAVTAHAAVIEPGITGNPDELPAETLHERAWALVEPLFRQTKEEAVARY
jgi:hypothetical protein